MILVDTSAWIDFFNGTKSPVNAELQRLLAGEAELFLTGLTYAEILQGIRHAKMLAQVQRHLHHFTILEPRSLETYALSAEIYRVCRRRGRTVRSIVDCLNAAIAMENQLAVLHRDRDYDAIARHFPLRIIR